MNIRGQHFDNESYQLSKQECIAIAAATEELLATRDYTIYKPIINGAYTVQMIKLCDTVRDIMDFGDSGNLLAPYELGIDEIVHLVCAGEGLL